jgi:hypothetical protein
VVASPVWASRQVSGKTADIRRCARGHRRHLSLGIERYPHRHHGRRGPQVPHQVDEWVDLDQLVDTARIYALTALHYLYPGEAR